LITRFWDILKLNVLFILYSIPIITVGPAFGALTSITMKIVQKKHIFIFSDFHEAFKLNWKQSLICSLIGLIVFFLLISSIFFYFNLAQSNSKFYIILFFCLFLIILFGFAWIHVYPLITTVSLSLKDILKNSVLLSIVCFKNTFLGTLVSGMILGFNVFFLPLTFPLYLLITFSLLSFIASFTAWEGIKKYIIK
jgi:uncharacterized membrane protein YesL